MYKKCNNYTLVITYEVDLSPLAADLKSLPPCTQQYFSW